MTVEANFNPEREGFTEFDQERTNELLKVIDETTGAMLEERTLALTGGNWESYNKLRAKWQETNAELWALNRKKDEALND